MKIMLITQLPPPTGGIAIWSNRYIDYCKNNNIDISVVNNAMIGERGSNFHAKKSLVVEIKRSIGIFKSILKQKKSFLPEIVHFNSACSPKGIIRDYLCIKLIGKIPIVFHCRCNIEDQLNNNRLGIYFFKLAAKKAKKIIVLNIASKNYIEKLGLNTEIVPNFISNTYLKTEPKQVNYQIQKVCFTGHIHKEKGIDEIVEVAKEFPNIQFTLVGKAEEKYEKLSDEKNIEMTGNLAVESVKEILDESDVYIFPSYTEGFSNALAEAMARGLPVIASDVGANFDMVENKGGIIVPCRQVMPIITALKKMEKKQVRKQMSEWNIEKVKKEYLISPVMKKLIDIYNDNIQEKG